MSVVIDFSEELMTELCRKTRSHGKDPAQFILELLENIPDVPAHLDPTPYKTKASLLSDEDWIAIETVFVPPSQSNSGNIE